MVHHRRRSGTGRAHDGDGGHPDDRARLRRALVGSSVGVFLFVAFVGLLAMVAPAPGPPAVLVSPPAAVASAGPGSSASAVAAAPAPRATHKKSTRKIHRRH